MNYLSEVYGKGGIYAKCVAASVANGIPIYTLETKAPKFIDAEFEKHRMLSSNSSSSRAIPFKELNEVYYPFDIRKNQKGMQGYEPLEDFLETTFATDLMGLYDNILSIGKYWSSSIHKQHLNRYLEPFMFQKKVVTATEWDNFFKLRLAPDAQPEIQELARCMKEAMEQVKPKEIAFTGWHLPYVMYNEVYPGKSGIEALLNLEDSLKCSVARCARVSYFNMDNSNPSIEKDLELYDRLLNSTHMSPMEHQATPMKYYYTVLGSFSKEKGTTHMDMSGNYWSGNFKGWSQFRQIISTWNK